MRIATYNLRYDSIPDGIPVKESLRDLPDPLVPPDFLGMRGEQPWSTRRLKIAQIIKDEGVEIVGFQEALIRQVDDMHELLDSGDWAWIGVGRDDGVSAGEFSPIFYRKSVVSLVSYDSFWLSLNPHLYCRSLPVSRPSSADKHGAFTILNTHLDDQSDDQRRLAASLLLARARFEAASTKGPVVMLGDFNSTSIGLDSGAYDITTGTLQPVPIDQAFADKYAVPEDQEVHFCFRDLRAQTPRPHISGNFATFTGFIDPGDTSKYARIDFIFGGENGSWTANGYKVATSLTDDGVLASDHRPIIADISF